MIHEWFADAEGRFDVSLSHSACQPLSVNELLSDADFESLRSLSLDYGAFEGLAELRTLIADSYVNMDPSRVLTFNGPGEAIYTFMRAMLKPGDEVVVPSPVFSSLQGIARQIGCRIVEWRAADQVTCSFDVNDLAAVCTASTRLIVINFPHNPSGQMLTEAELQQVVDVAESVDAILFSDEAFRGLEIPPTQTLPAACDLYERGVSMTGLSKPFGLGGLRIGWTATQSNDIHTAIKHYRYNTSEMTNTPCQWIACRALERADQILARNRATIAENLERLSTFVDRHNDWLTLLRPKVGPMAVVKQKTAMTSRQFCQLALDEERLLLVPGEVLEMSDRLLRLGTGMLDFASGLERLDRFLSRLARESN